MRPWCVLVVDDNADHRRQVQEALVGIDNAQAPSGFKIELEPSFERGSARAARERFDLVILDIRKDDPEQEEQAGVKAMKEYREAVFVPTIFYSAVAHLAKGEESLFVSVVSKSEGVGALTQAVVGLLDTRLLTLREHLDVVQRQMLQLKLPEFMQTTGKGLPRSEACGQLVRSLARELESPGVRDILGLQPDLLHPVECYILPPSSPHPMTGDLYRRSPDGGGEQEYWAVLNPACDLVKTATRKPKVADVLVARCELASRHGDVATWIAKQKSTESADKKDKAWQKAEFVLANRDLDRHLLPCWGAVPDLLANFRRLLLVPFDALGASPWTRVASLDSPFAESLNNRFTQFLGRIGAPDVDLSVIKARLLGP